MKNLKDLRKSLNLTQQQVADEIGISRTSYTRYEIDEREPDNATLIKIANLFHVSTDYLLGKTNIKQTVDELSSSESIVITEYQKELLQKNDELNPEYQAELKKYADLLKIKQAIDNNKKGETAGSLSENA
jgi:transcriptional regulator with XRE-family HTH domain